MQVTDMSQRRAKTAKPFSRADGNNIRSITGQQIAPPVQRNPVVEIFCFDLTQREFDVRKWPENGRENKPCSS